MTGRSGRVKALFLAIVFLVEARDFRVLQATGPVILAASEMDFYGVRMIVYADDCAYPQRTRCRRSAILAVCRGPLSAFLLLHGSFFKLVSDSRLPTGFFFLCRSC